MNLEEFLSLDDRLDVTIWPDASLISSSGAGDEFSYKSSILDVQDGKILVYFPPEDEPAFEWVRQGQKVRIVVTRSNGLWSFFPTVGQFVLKGSPRFWLNLPEDVEHIQRRKHVRVKHSFPLQITTEAPPEVAKLHTSALVKPTKPLTSSSAKTIVAPTNLQSVDISAGGIRFKTPSRLAPGQLLTVKFTLTPEFGELTSLARIVYCFSPEEMPASSSYAVKPASKQLGAKKEYIAALQFIDLPRDVEKRIIQECFHLELEQHRKGVGKNG